MTFGRSSRVRTINLADFKTHKQKRNLLRDLGKRTVCCVQTFDVFTLVCLSKALKPVYRIWFPTSTEGYLS